MTATNPIRVVQWGLGAMGQGMAKLITAKDGLELVGAIDVNPALDGKDIGEVLGIDPLGANVTTDPASILDSNKVDVVTIATTSWVHDQIADLRTIITAGINVVSIAEEMSCPEAQNPDMAKELDELAKKHGVSAVGCDLGQGKKLASTDHLNVSRGPGRREKRMSTIDDNWHTVTTGLLEHLDELRTRLNSEGLAGQHRWVFTLASAGGKGISKSVRVELEVVADRQPVHPVSF